MSEEESLAVQEVIETKPTHTGSSQGLFNSSGKIGVSTIYKLKNK